MNVVHSRLLPLSPRHLRLLLWLWVQSLGLPSPAAPAMAGGFRSQGFHLLPLQPGFGAAKALGSSWDSLGLGLLPLPHHGSCAAPGAELRASSLGRSCRGWGLLQLGFRTAPLPPIWHPCSHHVCFPPPQHFSS